MFGIIKKIFNIICIFLTKILNFGQKLFCSYDAKKRYKIRHDSPSLKNNSQYDVYKNRYKSRSLPYTDFEFKAFSPYMIDEGTDPSLIVPQVVADNYILPILNPGIMKQYFEDKNMFDKILPGMFPKTFFRRIEGIWYDRNYNQLEGFHMSFINELVSLNTKIVIKPTKNSSSGRNIEIFEYKGNNWISLSNGFHLSLEAIQKIWGQEDLIIQEAVTQHSYLMQFNSSSVNTIRIYYYNSVKDGSVNYLWGFIRIGGKGSIVDNAHAGGVMVKFDKMGRLDKKAFDQYGNFITEFNGIDFSKTEYLIPGFKDLLIKAQESAKNLFPNRLIAFDFTIDESGKPIIIEYNLRGYPVWSAQFAGVSPLGDFNDEILDYISQNKKLGKKFFYTAG